MSCLSLALGSCFGKSDPPAKTSIPGNANKICTIFGATGAQGGSVARYLAKSGLFAELRLVTRDVSKPSAVAIQKECAASGIKATLVAADMNDEKSMDAALAGATHSFCVTNWWELFFSNGAVPGVEGFVAGKKAQEIEEAQGYRWVDLCKKHNLEFVVYSGLCDAKQLSGGKHVNIYHFQGKAKIEQYMWDNLKGCSARAGCYMENFTGMIKPQPDGTLAFPIGDGPGLPMICIAEYGGSVAGVFKEGPEAWAGKVCNVVSEYVTGSYFCDTLSKAIGKPVKFFPCTVEMYAGFGFPGDAELAEMFNMFTMNYVTDEDIATAKRLHPAGKFPTLEEYFTANKELVTYGEAPAGGKICTIFGATGAQGGSVARYLAKSGLFAELRLVTRDVSKAAAKAIQQECQASGVKATLVAANMDDEASMDAALAGATHSFCVTNWWELFFSNGAVPGVEGFVAGKKAQEIEEAQGYRWVDLCKKHGLEFVVYSGLCDAEKLSGGKHKNIYHFQGKAKIEQYMWDNLKGCSVRAGCYMENFTGMIKPQPDGTLAFPIGDRPGLPMICVAEYGGSVAGVFKEGPEAWAGKVCNVVSEYVTGSYFCETLSKAIGKPVKFFPCTVEMYAGFGFPGDAELAEMFNMFTMNYVTDEDIATAKRLHPAGKFPTLEEYFTANKDLVSY